MHIFGLGLSRTGTTSLHVATMALGISSVHYPLDFALRWLAGDFSAQHFSRYTAYYDVPVCCYYPVLDQLYPDSKFILTVRDIDAWLDSCETHFARRPQHDQQTLARDMVRVATYGVFNFERNQFRSVYQRHCDAVMSYFSASRSSRLLVLDIAAADALSKLTLFLQEYVDNPLPMKAMPHLKLPYLGELERVAHDERAAKRSSIERLLAA